MRARVTKGDIRRGRSGRGSKGVMKLRNWCFGSLSSSAAFRDGRCQIRVEPIHPAPIRACGLLAVFLGRTEFVVMSVAACHPCMSQGNPVHHLNFKGQPPGTWISSLRRKKYK